MARKLSTTAPPQKTAAAAAIAARRPRPREEELVENIFLGVLLFFLAVLVFIPVFNAGFIWDDDQLLTANPQVHSPGGWWTLWLKPETADYFPLTSSTLWLEWRLWGLSAGGYHVTNVLLHATAVVLTWQMLKRLRIPGAWVAAAIFAVHPVCVESVAWISERKNTISQIFLLLSVIHFVRFEEKGKRWRYVAALACFALSLLAKTAVVMLPVILLVLAWWRYKELLPLRSSYELEDNRVEKWALLIGAPLGVAIAGASVVCLGWEKLEALPVLSGIAKMSGQVFGTIAAGSVAAAIGGFFAWRGFKGTLGTHWLERWAILGGGTAVAVILGALAGCFAWFILGTVLGIGGVMKAVGLGIPGVIAGVTGGWFGFRIMRKPRELRLNTFAGLEIIRMIPFFDVAVLLGVVTIYFQYGRAIGGEEIPLGNLWQRSASACFAAGFYLYSALWPFNLVEIYPQWHRAFSLLVTLPKPHWDPPSPESIRYYIQVIPGLIIGGLFLFCWTRRTQTWARAILVGLGCYFLAMLPALGLLKMSYMRLTLVADHFQYISIIGVIALIVAAGTTRALKPPYLIAASAFFVIVTAMNWGMTEDNRAYEIIWIAAPLALAACAIAQEYWKYVWGGFLVVVIVCFSILSFAQAEIYHSEETLWSATLAKNPNSWQAHNHLGAALYMRGDVKGAYPHFAAAVRLKPENPESHNNLGLALSLFGQMDEAIRQYETAVAIKDDTAMRTNLANAYAQVKNYEKAIENYKKAIALNDTNASAHCNLGFAYMQIGKIDEAIPEFMRTIEVDPQMPQGRADLAQALRLKGVNPDGIQVTSGSYSFDVNKALGLLHSGPQPAPAQ